MNYKLICFDVDGTLIDETIYIWVTLHDAFGISGKIRDLHFDCFRENHITYSEWFSLDILEWQKKGIRKVDLLRNIRKLRLMKGCLETLNTLRKNGFIVTVVSGSIDIVLDTLLPDFYFDDILINRIYFKKNGLISHGRPTPYDMQNKSAGLKYLLNKYQIKKEECVFIGDNFNDLSIAREAGLSISFNSKSEELDKISDIKIIEKDLRLILPYLT